MEMQEISVKGVGLGLHVADLFRFVAGGKPGWSISSVSSKEHAELAADRLSETP
jgi:hypothetical protein